MQALLAFIQKRKLDRFDLLALAGALYYLIQSIVFAGTQLSVLDEGAYLLKGWWFATGQYLPYQDFGPFTNHMPFSFLIPGWVQAAFGPGLISARTFAVLISLFFLAGLWILVRRLGASKWAAVAIWVLALNPALIKMYSVAVSQGLIIALLIWILVLIVGDNVSEKRINAAMFLAALMALTRLNMTAVLFVLPVYIWYQFGAKHARRSAAIGFGLWVLGHALFWPGILQMWANYTPESLTPFLDSWRVPTEAIASWTSNADFRARSLSVLETLRFHYVPLIMALFALLYWPKLKAWQDSWRKLTALFAGLLLLLLLLMHAVASLILNYCVFCFPLYTAFYSALGIVFLVAAWPAMQSDESPSSKWKHYIAIPLLILAPLLGAFYSNTISFLGARAVRSLLNLELPRFNGFVIAEGRIPLWGLLENRFEFSFAQSFKVIEYFSAVIIIVFISLLVSLVIFRISNGKLSIWPDKIDHLGKRSFLLLIAMGMLFSPTPILGGGYQTYDCDQNIPLAYEQLAEELEGFVDPGDLIFWRGGRSAIPLLYLPESTTFPPQLNGDYTYRLAGQGEELQRAGLWGPDLLEDWLKQADVILIERDLFRTWLQAAIESGPYALVGETALLTDCSPQSDILVYEYSP
jgi:hypothetical protein